MLDRNERNGSVFPPDEEHHGWLVSPDNEHRAKDGHRYQWLEVTTFDQAEELTGDSPLAVTIDSYNTFAQPYSEFEWDEATVRTSWDEVFAQHIQDRLPFFLYLQSLKKVDGRPPRILLGGAGTGRDALIVSLINPEAHVDAYDISTEMMKVAIDRLNWERTDEINQLIGSLEPRANGWIAKYAQQLEAISQQTQSILEVGQELANSIAAMTEEQVADNLQDLLSGSQNILSFKASLAEVIVQQVKRRLSYTTDDHRTIVREPGSIDAILDVATLQHLDADETEAAIARKLSFLAPGGIYRISLRADFEPLYVNGRANGRIFRDDLLRPEGVPESQTSTGWRYYQTYSITQAAALQARINSGEIWQQAPADIDVPAGAKFVVMGEGISTNANLNKPHFINFFVKRIA